jgi:hypothetical protein
MGEMADFALEKLLDEWTIDFLEDEYFNDYGDDKAVYNDERTHKVCKYCKTSNLHWEQHDGKWRLYDQSGTLHTCKKPKGSQK